MMLLVTGINSQLVKLRDHVKTKQNTIAQRIQKCEILIIDCVIFPPLLGTVFAITSVCHQSLDERSALHAPTKKIG